MQEVDLKKLEIDKKLECYICHMSGEILHKPGEILTLVNLTLMEECGIDKVAVIGNDEDPEMFKKKAQKKTVEIEDITSGEECPITLFDADKNVVVEIGSVIKEETLSELSTKGVKELYYDKDKQELESFQYEKYKRNRSC